MIAMIRRVLAIVLGIGLFASPLFAVVSGDLEGTVLDPGGASLSKANVTVKNLDTGATHALTTNEFGQFSVPQLELGTYQVTIEKDGFKTRVETTSIRSGEKTRLNVSMEVGKTSETVNVEGFEATLDVATAQISESLDIRQSLALPNQARDPVAFAELAPGVVPVTKDNSFLGTGSFNSNGSRGRANNITVDGVTAVDISTTGESGIGTISLDGIQEFKLITNNYDAEFGRNSGSQVQILTRSGTNAYHGTAYWYHQNAVFNARDWFDTSGHATPRVYNVGGFTVGGPVIKDHTFFFGHWEITKIRGGASPAIASVMTPAQAAAITDPTSKALFQALGAPTSPTGKLTSISPNLDNGHSWSVRVDQNLRGGHDSLFVRYAENPDTQITPGDTFIASNLPNGGASATDLARTASVGYTSTITNNLINQARAAFGRDKPNFLPVTTIAPPYGPQVDISGIDSLGLSRIIPQGRTQNTFQYGDTLSWVRGRHTIKFGVDVFRYQAPSYFDANFRGRAIFGSIAAFQAGTPTQWQQNFGTSARHNFALDHFWFVQDDWRMTRDLTVNLGFRLESSGGVSEGKGLLSNLDPNNQTPLGGGGTGPLGGLDLGGSAFHRNWNPAPRLGVAWNPNRGKFVLRAGYGIAYDFIYYNPITNLRFSAPFVPSIAVNSPSPAVWAQLMAGTAQAQTDAKAAIGQFLATQKNFGSISPVDQNLDNPRNQQWNFGVEYEAIKDLVFKASYIGTRNDQLQATIPRNLTQAALRPAPSTSIADQNSRYDQFVNFFTAESGNASGTAVNNRIDSRFNSVNQVKSVGSSSYDSMQLEVVKRVSHGLTFNANYTWAHSIDDVSDALGVLVNDSAGIQNPAAPLSANRGNSQFDIRHRLVLYYVWDIPFASHMTGWKGRLLDGWTTSGELDSRSGLPVTIYSGTVTVTDQTPGRIVKKAPRGISDVLLTGNSTAWANGDPTAIHPSAVDPVSKGNLTQPFLGNPGNSGRNRLRLAGLNNIDAALSKNTHITEGTSLELRWEVFNVLNHANFSGFSNVWTSAIFGNYTTTATDMRQMQASVKFHF